VPYSTQQRRYAFLLAWPFDSLGGVSGAVRNLLREFQTAGRLPPVAVEVSNAPAGWEPACAERPWPLVRTGPASTWNPKRPWRSIAAFVVKAPAILWRLRSVCRRYSIDVINAHFIGLEYFPFLVLRRLGMVRGPLILSFHGLDIREMRETRGLERWLSRVLLRGADWLVACSGGLRDQILLFVPECAPRTVSIPYGIDPAAFLYQPDVNFELPELVRGRRVILNVGAYEHKKGHDVLLQAFAQLERRRDTVLVIAGQGSSRPVTELAEKLVIQDDVVLFENLPHAQIAALMKRADLFVLSSRWEPFGIVLLEAAVARVPLVVTGTAGPAELIRHGHTGLIVPIDDPEALGAAISASLADPEEASRRAQRLAEHVAENFTWERAYRSYERLLN
jgi:glycosyltransferase involved in cell wall biosynthesis